MQKEYNHLEIEKKWQDYWYGNNVFKSEIDNNREKYYILDMFPYPSGAGLHVGHPEGYTATDILSRYKRMKGFNVLHPMGWDAFGLPAENYAIKTGTHPRKTTEENIITFKRQIKSIGFSYDWDREIDTTDSEYYKWTQWIFLQLFNKGLAYETFMPINWCPSCKTGLANEEVEGGICDRCKSKIEKKEMKQWMLKITEYAERLLNDLDTLSEWPEPIKEMQKNWIGKSEGCEFSMGVIARDDSSFGVNLRRTGAIQCDESGKTNNNCEKIGEISVYTTRIDTVFGMTYAVIAPDHPDVPNFLSVKQKKICEDYIHSAKNKSDLERTGLEKEKTGVFTGTYVVNPFNGDKVPLWIADYVLGHYGTGAVMAVPAHDERDFEFAKKYGFDIKPVIYRNKGGGIDKDEILSLGNNDFEGWFNLYSVKNGAFTDYGVLFNSNLNAKNLGEGQEDHAQASNFGAGCKPAPVSELAETFQGNVSTFDGLNSEQAKIKLTEYSEKNGFGKLKVNYKLRDWVFSRQRYWGEPIPVIHCDKCGIVGVPEKDLPVRLPQVEKYEPTGTGESPLAGILEWVNTKCPECNGPAKRETNTMPQWAGSSWYYLKFMDAYEERRGLSLVGKGAATDEAIHTPGKLQTSTWIASSQNSSSQGRNACVLPESEKYWGPVDMYVGGAEHAVLHLLYSRFWHKVLYDLGYVSTIEPFKSLRNQGMILSEDGRKMSKSLGNVINPDEVVNDYGADTLRLYEMFMGPFEQVKSWNTKGVLGVRRFLDKVWRLREKVDFGNKKAIIIHGFTAGPGNHWIPKLRLELIKQGYYVQTPSMPNTNNPKYEEWKAVLDKLEINEDTILIGHSLGGGFIPRYLNDTGRKVGDIYLIAPCYIPKSKGIDIEGFGKVFDSSKVKELTSNIYLVHSDNDIVVGNDSFEKYKKDLNPIVTEIKGANHCCGNESDITFNALRNIFGNGSDFGNDLILSHKTIKKIGQQIEDFKFNTAISDMMVLVNELSKQDKIHANIFEDLLFILSPFAPHICEELWSSLGHVSSLTNKPWPYFDEALCIDEENTIVVQINGKIRGEFKASKDISKEDAIVKAKEIVAKHLEGQNTKKEIYVVGKLVSLVI